MSIQNVNSGSTLNQVQEQVGVSMLNRALKGSQEESAELVKSGGGIAPLPEGSGSTIDIEA